MVNTDIMPMVEPGEVTRLLAAASAGDADALKRLIPLVYDELRRLAHRQLAGERRDHTLNTGALVHEAYLKLAGLDRIEWGDRAHFFGIAAGAMRRILIDYAVRRRAAKRGGGRRYEPLDRVTVAVEERAEELIALDEALERLQALDARQAKVVEWRFFAGMSIEETAAALDVSPATVKRDWITARAWLNRELGP
jgi:RNA polymerase sigma factor (TIGR02999 family)